MPKTTEPCEFCEERKQLLAEDPNKTRCNKVCMYRCSRLEGHDGKHVACFDSYGSHKDQVWSDDIWDHASSGGLVKIG